MAFKTKLVLKSSGFRVMQTLVMVVIGFAMMPFLISTLGEDLYGLWVVIGSIVGTYYLLDLGFSQAVTRYVAKYIHQGNTEAANRIINTALVLYTLLGFLVLLISIVAAIFGVDALMGESRNISLAQTLLIILGLTLAIDFPAKSFPGIVSAYMRYDFVALVRTSKAILDALLIYIFLSNGFGLVAMAVITMVTGLISTGVYVRFTNSLFKELTFERSLVNVGTFKDIFHFSKWVFISDISTLLRSKMDIWFIAFFQSSAVLTVYYVPVRLIEYALQVLTQATGITGPIFTEYYARNEIAKLHRSLSVFLKINVMFGAILLSGFVLIGEGFIRLWMGESFSYQDAYLVLVILALGRVAAYFSAPLQSLLMTFNRHSISAWVALLETLMSGLMMLVLVPKYGIFGAAVSITVPTILGRAIIVPALTAKLLEIDINAIVFRVAIFLAISAVLLVLAKYYCLKISEPNFVPLAAITFLMIMVQMLLGFILFDTSERAWLMQQFNNKWSRFMTRKRGNHA